MENSPQQLPEEHQRHLHSVPDQEQDLAMGQFQEVNMRTYSNGANHLYGLDGNGKNVHISHDAVLQAYGAEARPKADEQPVHVANSIAAAVPGKTPRRATRAEGPAQYEGMEAKPEEVKIDESGKSYRRATRPGTLEVRAAEAMDEARSLKDLQRQYVQAADIDQDEEKAAQIALKIDALTAAKETQNSDELDFENDPEGAEAALIAAGEAEMVRIAALQVGEATPDADAEAGADAGPTIEPVTDMSKKGLAARVRSLWRGAKAELGIFLSQTPAEYFKNKEQGEKRRMAAVGIAAGSVLVAGLVTVFAMKHGNHLGGGVVADQLGGQGSGGANGGNVLPFAGAPKGGDIARHLTDSTLHVPKGKGFEDAIQQQYHLSDAQAHTVFQDVRPSIEHSPGTYHQGSDLRISHAGDFSFNAQAQQALEDSVKKVRKAA